MFMRLIDSVKFIVGANPAALTSTAGDGDYVSMKGYERLTIVVTVLNDTTVTGGAITLKQATTVAGGGEKPLAFTKMYQNTDTAAGEALTETAVTNNTFTTDATNSKGLLYVIEVASTDLDINNGFDCVRMDSASMANALGCVLYLMSGPRYTGNITATGN